MIIFCLGETSFADDESWATGTQIDPMRTWVCESCGLAYRHQRSLRRHKKTKCYAHQEPPLTYMEYTSHPPDDQDLDPEGY